MPRSEIGLLVSYSPLARLRRRRWLGAQLAVESLPLAAVIRRRHFDRAVTHLLARGAPGAYSAYRHQLCCKAAKLQLGPRLLKQVRWNTNTRCGRVLTALKAAATAATRTRHTRAALSERRETAEHSMQAAAPPPASDPASTKQRSAARDERTSIGNLSD